MKIFLVAAPSHNTAEIPIYTVELRQYNQERTGRISNNQKNENSRTNHISIKFTYR